MSDSQQNLALEQIAAALTRRGLATPARIFLDIIAPVDFIASQMTLFARPFVPRGRWMEYVDSLSDPQGWMALRAILRLHDS